MSDLSLGTKALRLITGLLGSVIIVVSILMVNLLQLSTLLIRLFSKAWFRKINGLIAHLWWNLLVFLVEKVQGTRIVFTGEPLPAHENAILIANHQGIADVLFILGLASRKRRLMDLKWFAKDALKYLPGMGWGLVFLECVFLKRKWSEDQESIRKTFANLTENHVPFWLMTFIEGTRQTPSKLLASRKYAQAKNLDPFNHLLFPRVKGFIASVQGLGSHLEAVYDVTIAYPKHQVPSLWNLIQGNAGVVTVYTRRFDRSVLPVETEKLESWVLALFKEKDQMLSEFGNTGILSLENSSTVASPSQSLSVFPPS